MNLQICAGEDGRTAIYCKECRHYAYAVDGYFPQIEHAKNCWSGLVPADTNVVEDVKA